MLLFLILMLAITLPAQGGLDEGLGLELADVKKLAAPATEVTRFVADVTGAVVEDARLFTARATDPRSRQPLPVRIASLAAPGAGKNARVVVCVTDDRMLAAGLLGVSDVVAKRWELFFEQFPRLGVPRRKDAAPVASLHLRRAEARLGATAEMRELRTLLRIREIMLINAAYAIPVFMKGAGPLTEESRRELDRNSKELSRMADALEAHLGSKKDRFKQLAEGARSFMNDLPSTPEAVTEGLEERLKQRSRESCGGCHMLTGHRLNGPLMMAAKARRGALGAGDGYYVVLHDILPRVDRMEESQQLATLVRAASLLVSRD